MKISLRDELCPNFMKKEYLEANPDAKTMDNTTLKMPPKNYILPLPKPKLDD